MTDEVVPYKVKRLEELFNRLSADIDDMKSLGRGNEQAISNMRYDLQALKLSIDPIIRAHNENASSMRRIMWTAIATIMMTLAGLGITQYILRVTGHE